MRKSVIGIFAAVAATMSLAACDKPPVEVDPDKAFCRVTHPTVSGSIGSIVIEDSSGLVISAERAIYPFSEITGALDGNRLVPTTVGARLIVDLGEEKCYFTPERSPTYIYDLKPS